MKKLISCLALSTALVFPSVVLARLVTMTTTLKQYGGDGAYIALYLTDASGNHVRTLWLAGQKQKYYKHLSDWYRATGGSADQINGITGASVGAGQSLKVTADLEEALFDAGYSINIDTAAEDMRESPREISLPLTSAGQSAAGRYYIAGFIYE